MPNVSSREFFNTRPLIIEYMTLELYHPAAGNIKLVTTHGGGAYFEKVLGGEVYQPSSMAIKETIQDARNAISYDIQLGRIGTQAKAFAKDIDKYPLGWMIEVKATVKYWLSSDTIAPYRPPVTLSVANFAIDGDGVAITLETGNPRGQSVATRYNGREFPGTNAKV